MPIRFRCVYCDKLLGIARRKAGAVVNCPQCHQPLIVPTPDPEPEPTGPGEPNKLFERDDVEEMFDPNQDQTHRGPVEAPVPGPLRSSIPPDTHKTLPPIQNGPSGLRTRQPANAIMLTTGRLVLLFVFVLVLVVGAFAGGYLIGKG